MKTRSDITKDDALKVLENGYRSGISEYMMDVYRIDHNIELSWELVRDALLGNKSLLTQEQAMILIDNLFDQDDPFWEDVIVSVWPELWDADQIPLWSDIIHHFQIPAQLKS